MGLKAQGSRLKPWGSGLTPQASCPKPQAPSLEPLYIRRQRASRGLVDAVAEHVIGLHQRVNLTCTLVNHRSLAVAIVAAHGIFVRVAVRAVNLDRVARGALRRGRRS